MVYLFGFFFTVPGTAVVWVIIINMFLATGLTIVRMIFEFYMMDDYTSDILDATFIVAPQYCFSFGIINLLIRSLTASKFRV